MDCTLDIFNDSYFENDYDFDTAEEALGTSAKKALAGIFGGPLGGLIANVVHNSKVNKSIVVSYSQLINTGLSEKKAAAECDKAVNFLISKGFLTDDYKGSKIVKFSDLTKDGKKFMKGYYSVMDKVTHFNYAQAINKSGKGLNKEAIGQSASGVTHGAINAVIVDRSVKCLAKLAQAFDASPLVAATTEFMGKSALSIAGVTIGIPGIALSVVNIGASIKTAMNASYFKKNMTAQECAFIAQFPDELLSDFGRMLKSDCMESVFDDAFESGYYQAINDMRL